ncbi:MAG: ring-cleaving dioxygenase [Salinarimonadaceae bacterium]|nr:MAG: ring-cleaving dioxygenase [Salinarimonadaceae bacterium]
MSGFGIHHVTAMARGARRNLAFHTGLLGQRLVKKTVNFEDPATYHLYYGDDLGRPGTALTYFPWENAAPGLRGDGETAETAMRVPEGALDFWRARFDANGVAHETARRNGREALLFADLDGMRFALVGLPGVADEPAWTSEEIGAAEALRGFESVTLDVAEPEKTAAILRDVLGFSEAGGEGGRLRFESGAAIGAAVELVASRHGRRPRLGAGSVHHVAFRAADDATQEAMAQTLFDRFGIASTEQKDRKYFRSIYFREPNGVLFEIATDEPGFAIDEAPEALGGALMLPAFLETQRARIEAALPPLDTTRGEAA